MIIKTKGDRRIMTKRTYRFEVETPNMDMDDMEILHVILPYIKQPFTSRKVFFVSALSKEDALEILRNYLITSNIAGNIIEPFDVTSVPQRYRNLDYKTVIYWNNARTLRFKKEDQPY